VGFGGVAVLLLVREVYEEGGAEDAGGVCEGGKLLISGWFCGL